MSADKINESLYEARNQLLDDYKLDNRWLGMWNLGIWPIDSLTNYKESQLNFNRVKTRLGLKILVHMSATLG